MIVVSDTSPILNLERIGRLELLHLLYEQVVIPDAVYRELSAEGSYYEKAPWLIVKTVVDQAQLEELSLQLDPGEAAALVLAKEIGADLVLIDERRARRIAKNLNLNVTGLLGILRSAKARSFIEATKPILDDLITQARFRVGAELYEDFCAQMEKVDNNSISQRRGQVGSTSLLVTRAAIQILG